MKKALFLLYYLLVSRLLTAQVDTVSPPGRITKDLKNSSYFAEERYEFRGKMHNTYSLRLKSRHRFVYRNDFTHGGKFVYRGKWEVRNDTLFAETALVRGRNKQSGIKFTAILLDDDICLIDEKGTRQRVLERKYSLMIPFGWLLWL
jgi:Txe/YoeB family toxin of Txe-Axe toxin-antitoxin module